MLLLAGDIGGTKSWLRAVDSEAPEKILAEAKYPSQTFDSLESIIQQFSQTFQFSHFESACFGLPGPVSGRQADLTNLPWHIDADHLQQQCSIDQVELINDFQAAAFGIDGLNPSQYVVLHPGEYDGRGNRLVVGAGTGLGIAPIVRCMDGFWPQPCEGGHMDFAPVNQTQQALLSWFWQVWPHVSYERILSGAGLEALYAFFAGLDPHDHQAWFSAEQVYSFAEQGQQHAVSALDAFVEIYGSYIGNVALLWPSRAGVYIAGGIAGKIKAWMEKSSFLYNLHNKGRMQKLVMSMPIYLVTDPALGLTGAMFRARRLFKPCQ